MNFCSGASIDGKLIYGYENGWHWERNGGHYDLGRDFFWVHLEINEHFPGRVKLHVESPKAADDSTLNAIKKDVVSALSSAQFKNLVEGNGWKYVAGNRAKAQYMEKNKSTQVFRVELPEHQLLSTHQANIERVSDVIGPAIDEVIRSFTAQLKREFPGLV